MLLQLIVSALIIIKYVSEHVFEIVILALHKPFLMLDTSEFGF